MKIGILRLNCGDFGKIGMYNVQEMGLARVLRDMGHKVQVLYLDKSIKEPKQLSDVNVTYLPCKSIGVHGIFNLKMLEKYNLDIMILFADNQFWQKNVINWCKKHDIRCLCYIGRISTQANSIINKLFYKYLMMKNKSALKSSINITKTTNAKNSLVDLGIPVYDVIPVGLDINLLYGGELNKNNLRKELLIPNDKKILLFVGRLDSNKNPLFALKVLESLLIENSNYYMIMIGKGNLKESVLKTIHDKGISQNVRYVESVPNNEIYKYYTVSDCLINPCDSEIFGMAILESMYYRCPIVAMKADGPLDIIKDGVSGMLCNSYSLDEWKEKIKKVIGNTYITNNSYNQIIDKFNWNVCAKMFEKVIKE